MPSGRWLRYRLRRRPYAVRNCAFCGCEFNPASSRQSRCSSHRSIPCQTCKALFVPGRSAQRFCSVGCGNKQPYRLALLRANRGNRPRTYHLRHRDKHGSVFDREWRQRVFERDNFTCQGCGEHGGRLQADHIKPFKEYPELRWELSNGRTLCISCHKRTPTYGWSKYWHGRARQGLVAAP